MRKRTLHAPILIVLAALWFVFLIWGVANFAITLRPLRLGWWSGGPDWAWPAYLAALAFVAVGLCAWGPFELPSKHQWLCKMVKVQAVFSVSWILLIVAGRIAGYVGNGSPVYPGPSGEVAELAADGLPRADSLYAWARSLDYDEDPHYSDEKRLEAIDTVSTDSVHAGAVQYEIIDTVPDPSRRTRVRIVGPLASVFPVKGTHRNGRGDYMGSGPGKGRVVARFVVREWDGGVGYPKLRLPPDTSYLMIDSMTVEAGNTLTARALIITPDTTIDAGRIVRVHFYKWRWSSNARARWQYDPNDECVCDDCLMHGWCGVGCT